MIIPAHRRLVTAAELRDSRRQTASLSSASPASRRAFSCGNRVSRHRADFEFYPTPPEATRALLSVETFDGSIWEPACGQGHIAKVLVAAGHEVVATDLVDWGYGTPGRDFLAEPAALATHIVTNPPYGNGLADAFVGHALKLTANTRGKVAMLLALQSLAHPLRHEHWTGCPPASINILDECQCWPYGDPGRATTAIGKQRYCWAVWAPGYEGPTVVRWLS